MQITIQKTTPKTKISTLLRGNLWFGKAWH